MNFPGIKDIQKNSSDTLKVIFAEQFSGRFQQWKHCMVICIEARGQYFEGDKLDVADE